MRSINEVSDSIVFAEFHCDMTLKTSLLVLIDVKQHAHVQGLLRQPEIVIGRMLFLKEQKACFLEPIS